MSNASKPETSTRQGGAPEGRSPWKARLYDIAAALPLICWYALGTLGLVRKIDAELLSAPMSARVELQITAQALTIAFLALHIVLFLIRRLPVAKEEGWLPRLVAAFSTNTGVAFLMLPTVKLGLALAIFSDALVSSGMLLSVVTLFYLGRSFSVFPQARRLVTNGPYAIVRHPLYLCEFLVTAGSMWQFAQPWSALITVGTLLIQFPRMHYEEHILRASFPAYERYCAQVRWRLVPLLY